MQSESTSKMSEKEVRMVGPTITWKVWLAQAEYAEAR